ncbi:MAG: hypothetical protein BWY75_03513 [bacterium ADurb.Bin425]|nr:MAG: hypothetical protein BWY75_03513 [bacterium ADurb.Bin425]
MQIDLISLDAGDQTSFEQALPPQNMLDYEVEAIADDIQRDV